MATTDALGVRFKLSTAYNDSSSERHTQVQHSGDHQHASSSRQHKRVVTIRDIVSSNSELQSQPASPPQRNASMQNDTPTSIRDQISSLEATFHQGHAQFDIALKREMESIRTEVQRSNTSLSDSANAVTAASANLTEMREMLRAILARVSELPTRAEFTALMNANKRDIIDTIQKRLDQAERRRSASKSEL